MKHKYVVIFCVSAKVVQRVLKWEFDARAMEASVVHYDYSINVHVTPYVNSGILKLMMAYQILSNVYIESDEQFSKFQIQKMYDLILNANKDFEKADTNLSVLRLNANQKFEKSISEEKILSDIIRNLEVGIERTTLELNEKKDEIENAQIHLKVAHEEHKYAKRYKDRAVDEYYHKKREEESGFNAIPFIGGIVAYLSGLSDEIERAKREMEYAQDDYKYHEKILDSRKLESKDLQSNIASLKKTLVFHEHKLKGQTAGVAKLKHNQKPMNENRVTLGDYLHISSTLLRMTKILLSESSEIISVKPLLNVFHDVAKKLKMSSHKTKMLKSEEFKSFSLLVDPAILENRQFWHRLTLVLIFFAYLVLSIMLCFVIYFCVFEVRPVLLYLYNIRIR